MKLPKSTDIIVSSLLLICRAQNTSVHLLSCVFLIWLWFPHFAVAHGLELDSTRKIKQVYKVVFTDLSSCRKNITRMSYLF